MAFLFELEEVLKEVDLTRNALAVEAKIRPATVADLYNGKSKRLELPTISSILDVLNKRSTELGLNKTYTIDSLIRYTYDKDAPQD